MKVLHARRRRRPPNGSRRVAEHRKRFEETASAVDNSLAGPLEINAGKRTGCVDPYFECHPAAVGVAELATEEWRLFDGLAPLRRVVERSFNSSTGRGQALGVAGRQRPSIGAEPDLERIRRIEMSSDRDGESRRAVADH